MIIVYENGSSFAVAEVLPQERRQTVYRRDDAGELIAEREAETDAEFIARMVAERVPAGARHMILNPLLLVPSEAPERWVVDWARGTIAIGPLTKEELAAYAAERRWHVMCAGITIGGLQVPGDDTAQTRLSLARARLKSGELAEPLSYTIGRVTVPLTLAILDAIVPALAQITQAAFAVQGTVVAGINAGTITTSDQIDAADWPGQGQP